MPYALCRFALAAALSAALVLSALAWPATAPRAEERPKFFDLDVIVVPVLGERQLRGHFIFSPVLELEQGMDSEGVAPYVLHLRDAMLKDMKRYAERHPDILERVDLNRVKRVLQRATERVTGGGMVRQVLLSAVYQRPKPPQAVVPAS